MTHNEKIKYIADYYGSAQYMQTSEECSELIKALSKLQRATSEENRLKMSTAIGDVIEEIADVEVILEQLKYLLDIPNSKTIEEIKEGKLDRQIRRIEETINV